MTHVRPASKSGVDVCVADAIDKDGLSCLPGAEPVLSHSLFLQHTGVLQFDGAGNEAHLTALLHQTPDPPVIVVLLNTQSGSSKQ